MPLWQAWRPKAPSPADVAPVAPALTHPTLVTALALTRNWGLPSAVSLMAEKPSSELPPGQGHKDRASPTGRVLRQKAETKIQWRAAGSRKSPSTAGLLQTHGALTRGIDAVEEGLHVLVALGLIGVEICAGADDPATAIPKSLMGSVLLLPLFCSWGGRGWRWATQPCQAPTSIPRSFCCGCRGEGLQLGP